MEEKTPSQESSHDSVYDWNLIVIGQSNLASVAIMVAVSGSGHDRDRPLSQFSLLPRP